MPLSRGNKSLRNGRRSISGHFYLLTTTTKDRKKIFKVSQAADIVMESLRWLDKNEIFSLDTAVVMPDHLHFIAELRRYSLPEIMKKLKGYTARKINMLLGLSGQLWQIGYHDHAIRKDESLNELRRYCLENPVRAGIIDDYLDYPFRYCRELMLERGNHVAAKSRSNSCIINQ